MIYMTQKEPELEVEATSSILSPRPTWMLYLSENVRKEVLIYNLKGA